ncbi:CAP10 domain-containing protein [Mycena chlorophos]|uniref:CAP10 domain-containing protein n=1 Tax=Mycena chlorophos TaxID=658473 RepID=A0A8H6WJB9_MYCCL|nr:CAP10 domain-containing protein [Mycena chlorophos]
MSPMLEFRTSAINAPLVKCLHICAWNGACMTITPDADIDDSNLELRSILDQLFERIPRLTRLKKLEAYGLSFTPRMVEHLAQIPRDLRLTLHNCDFREGSRRGIHQNGTLAVCEFAWSIFFGDYMQVNPHRWLHLLQPASLATLYLTLLSTDDVHDIPDLPLLRKLQLTMDPNEAFELATVLALARFSTVENLALDFISLESSERQPYLPPSSMLGWPCPFPNLTIFSGTPTLIPLFCRDLKTLTELHCPLLACPTGDTPGDLRASTLLSIIQEARLPPTITVLSIEIDIKLSSCNELAELFRACFPFLKELAFYPWLYRDDDDRDELVSSFLEDFVHALPRTLLRLEVYAYRLAFERPDFDSYGEDEEEDEEEDEDEDEDEDEEADDTDADVLFAAELRDSILANCPAITEMRVEGPGFIIQWAKDEHGAVMRDTLA